MFDMINFLYNLVLVVICIVCMNRSSKQEKDPFFKIIAGLGSIVMLLIGCVLLIQGGWMEAFPDSVTDVVQLKEAMEWLKRAGSVVTLVIALSALLDILTDLME